MGVLVEKVRLWVCLVFIRVRNFRRDRRNLAAYHALTAGKSDQEIDALADELEWLSSQGAFDCAAVRS